MELPGDIVGEIAKKNARAYWLCSMLCRSWLRAIRIALPKFEAVRLFSRKVVVDTKSKDGYMRVKVNFTLLPNGKKNGIYFKKLTAFEDDKASAEVHAFYLNGERLYEYRNHEYLTPRVWLQTGLTNIIGSNGMIYMLSELMGWVVGRYNKKTKVYYTEWWKDGKYIIERSDRVGRFRIKESKVSLIHGTKFEFFAV